MVAAVLAVVIHVSWAPATPATIGPTPALNTSLDITTPVTGLTDGSTVSFVASTPDGAITLSKVDAKICVHGFTSYGSTTFGYDGSSGVRCVYQPDITAGGLTDAQYRSGPNTFSGAHTSGTLSIKVGTGTVEWINNTGDGPQSITCDSSNQCDLVVQVSIVGDVQPAAYFIQPMTFAGGGGTTTTTSSTSTSSTTSSTSTSSTSSTTTSSTTSSTTSTTAPTTTTTAPTTTTTLAPGNSVTPSTVASGGVVTVASTGWKTGSTVTAELHSDPVSLGALTADNSGDVSGQFTIPVATATGAHEIVLTGTDPDDAAKTQSFTITVAASNATTSLPGGTAGTLTGTTGTGGTGGGGLAFTGSDTRNLASLALLILALGLFLIARTTGHRIAKERP